MSALIGLQCHLCKTPFPAEAIYVCDRCLGPLEPVYDYRADPPHPRGDRAAAEEPVALPRAAADHRRAAHRLQLRLHAARALRPPGRAARRQRAVHQGRLGQPSDAVLQGPRRLGRRDARRGARLQGAGLRVDRQPRQQRRRRTPRGSASSAACSSPTTSRRASCSARRSSARRFSPSPATTTT